MSRARLIDLFVFLAIACASSGWCASVWTRLGPTFDEPHYLRAGLESWRSGSNRQLMVWGTMPLPVDVQTLPIYLWEQQRGEAFDPVSELPILLPIARAMNLPFWWLLLFCGLCWGRELGGPKAGWLACGFIGFDPNLLAHAALATTDIALTATVLMATFHFHINRASNWRWRVLWPGFLYGVALVAKASALPYVPLLWLVFGTHRLALEGKLSAPKRGALREWLRQSWDTATGLRTDIAQGMILGAVVMFVYCGCDWKPEPTFVDWAHKLPEGTLKTIMVPISENLRVFPNALEGIAGQIKHNMKGHFASFAAGVYHEKPAWYYFPVILSIKLPDPTIALLGFLLLTRPRALRNPAIIAAFFLLLFSLTTRVQLGIRLVFPLVSFLLIGMSVACQRPGTRLGNALGAVMIFATLLITISLWPDPLRHVNNLWGGQARAPERVCDSNFDWGQGLPDLKRWWEANGEPRLHVWYYGSDPAILMAPFFRTQVNELPHDMSVPPKEVLLARVGDGYFAVSTTNLYACPDRRPETLAITEWLRSLTPVGRTPTYIIYRLAPATAPVPP